MKPLLPEPEECGRLPKGLVNLLTEEVPSKAKAIDEANQIPRSLLDRLASEGFFAIAVPKEYGGLGLGFTGLYCVARIAARSSIPVASVAVIHGGVATLASTIGGEAVRRRLKNMAKGDEIAAVSITERGGGSDLVANLTTIVRESDGSLLVRGEKVFTSNGVYATLYAVLAREEGGGPRDLTMVVVERSDRVHVEPLNLTSFRGAGLARVVYEDARADPASIIGGRGKGFRVALDLINLGRLSYAAMGLGAVEGLLAETVSYASSRQMFGQRLIDFQGPRWGLARIYIDAYLLAQALNAASRRVDETGSPDPVEAALLKVKASELAVETAQLAARLHGGRGFEAGSLTERMLRDTLALTVGEGANEVLLDFVSKRWLESLEAHR